MKKFIAIGLGNFGINLAKKLEENGSEVLGIDISEEAVESAKDFISHSVIGDASNKDTLKSLHLKDFDGAIISIGQDMAPSILIVLHLQEIGLENIVVRAVSEDHGKILEKIGVSEVIYPETEVAMKLANRLSLKNALDYIPLSEEHGILEVVPPKNFLNKSLRNLQISQKYKCQVIALMYKDREKAVKIPPEADDIIDQKTIMVVIGKLSDINRLQGVKS